MSKSTTSNLKVLVVDDEEKFLNLSKKNLNLRGFEVETAEAGEEAIAKIYQYHPKVVLLDVMMPRLTGDELVKMITDWRPEIQVIMVSANLSRDVEEECLRNGAYACIKKPVNFDQLAETIKQAGI
ncbi:MAG: response regulator [Nitrospinota bacterium]|nr:response regulator [Nitrospinota bacterium]